MNRNSARTITKIALIASALPGIIRQAKTVPPGADQWADTLHLQAQMAMGNLVAAAAALDVAVAAMGPGSARKTVEIGLKQVEAAIADLR